MKTLLLLFLCACRVIAMTTEQASEAAAANVIAHRGGHIDTVRGDSMLPTITSGSWIVWRRTPYAEIKIGDVLVYMGRPNAALPDRIRIVHRVVAKDRLGFIMSGDNNARSESWDRVTPETYIGTVAAIYPITK